jgi:hypothetical protein
MITYVYKLRITDVKHTTGYIHPQKIKEILEKKLLTAYLIDVIEPPFKAEEE